MPVRKFTDAQIQSEMDRIVHHRFSLWYSNARCESFALKFEEGAEFVAQNGKLYYIIKPGQTGQNVRVISDEIIAFSSSVGKISNWMMHIRCYNPENSKICTFSHLLRTSNPLPPPAPTQALIKCVSCPECRTQSKNVGKYTLVVGSATECCVCMTAPANFVFPECGHLNSCVGCVVKMSKK